MQFSLEQVPWMPSPPLAPISASLDLAYLRSMTLGDVRLEREVLELFKAQTRDLIARLAAQPANARELAHTLKGSARAIGAFEVGEAALALEDAMRERKYVKASFKALETCVAEAFAAIDAVLANSN